MAELLIRAITNGPDPGHWKRGHVVFVAEDGHEWGRMERPPHFYVVRLPGVSREEAWRKWRESEQIGVDENGEPIFSPRPMRGIDVDASMQPPKAMRRMWRFAFLLRKRKISDFLDRGEKLAFRRPPERRF